MHTPQPSQNTMHHSLNRLPSSGSMQEYMNSHPAAPPSARALPAGSPAAEKAPAEAYAGPHLSGVARVSQKCCAVCQMVLQARAVPRHAEEARRDVSDLAVGLHRVDGERGERVAQGQRQRARAGPWPTTDICVSWRAMRSRLRHSCCSGGACAWTW